MSGVFAESDFYSAIQNNNYEVLLEGIAELENKLFTAWNCSNHQSFEDELAYCIQRTKRIRKQINERKRNPAYQIGSLEGIVETYSCLFQEEKKQLAIDSEISSIIPRPGNVTKNVFSKLHELLLANQWITHGELAQAVGTTDTSLTNIMKKLVLSRAVESVKNGKYTNYRLTDAGRRYYEGKILSSLPEKSDTRILDGLDQIQQSIVLIERKINDLQQKSPNTIDLEVFSRIIEQAQKSKLKDTQNEDTTRLKDSNLELQLSDQTGKKYYYNMIYQAG